MLTQDETIKMARDAGFGVRKGNVFTCALEHLPITDAIERLAALCYAAGQRDMKERAKAACETERYNYDAKEDSAYDQCIRAIEQIEIREPS